MGYVKKVFIASLIIGLTGCATTKQKQSIYEQGFREGVAENIDEFLEEKGNDPFIGYDWIEPILQEVTIPAHIGNGVFIPEHEELVIINPGAWQLSPGYPILKGGQGDAKKQTTLQLFEGSASDITVLPADYHRSTGASSAGEERKDYSRGMGEED